MAASDDYLTLREAAELAGVKIGLIHRAARLGRLKTTTMPSGARIVRLTTRAWLHAFMQGRSGATRPPGQPQGTADALDD